MDLSHIPILDHHAHPLLKKEATQTAVSFQQWFTESTHPDIHQHHIPRSLFFRTAIKWLAEILECEATVTAVLAARAAQDYKQWTHYLFQDARIDYLLCDYGYSSPDGYDATTLPNLLPCPVKPILRLETYFQELIIAHSRFDQAIDAFIHTLRTARQAGYVALKSIIAYRSGLTISPVTKGLARTSYDSLHEESKYNPKIRLADKSLCDYLLWLAATEAEKLELPIQIHTGFGDEDADLLTANPLQLRPLIEKTKAPLVLLHAGWPYYREMAHLAALYPHVWLDLSLAIPFATTGIPAMLRDILGMAHHSKILFATDAFTMPEIYWLAAKWGRWSLGKVLAEFMEEGFMTAKEGEETAVSILNSNSQKLYSVTL
ncbi:MAG: amidohydrolase family protein [Chloroflexota bacterium]